MRSLAFLAALTFSLFAPTAELQAQRGGLFLLVPFGARAVAQGDAVAADTTLGSESMWWNAASLARLPKREIAVHHASTAIASTSMIAVAVPSEVLGTIALSALIADYGSTDVTDPNTGAPVGGRIGTYDYQLAAAYASPIGRRLNASLTYKFIMIRSACTGNCGATTNVSGSSNAADFGLQYMPPSRVPLTLGATIRNLGPAMQFRDAAQADALPRILQVGARVGILSKRLSENEIAADVSGDLFQSPAFDGLMAGLGLSVVYRNQLSLEAGYKHQSGQGGGPSIGFGFRTGGLGIELARRFDSFSSQLGETPTYVMIRARF